MTDLARIESKIDKLAEKIEGQGVQLARHSVLHEKNTLDLAEHIRRTNILEKQMETALLPIKSGKFLVAVCAGLAVIYSLIKLFI